MTPETIHPERCVLRKLRMIGGVVMNLRNLNHLIFRSLKLSIDFLAPAQLQIGLSAEIADS